MSTPLVLPAPNRAGATPALPPVSAWVAPVHGTGEITFSDHPGDPRRSSRIILRLKSPPWHTTGVQPFAWDYLEAVGAREHPVLRVVADRTVAITQAHVRSGGREQPAPVGAYPLELGPGRWPRVVVYRPQDSGLVPSPEDVIEPHRIVGEPHVEGPDPLVFPSLADLTTVKVEPAETGVRISHVKGGFQVRVRLRRVDQPAAFAYLVETGSKEQPGRLLTLVIKVVHTPGVEVHVRVHESYKPVVLVLTSEQQRVKAVPAQGAELPDDLFAFKVHPFDDVIPSRDTLLRIAVFETLISLIPVVGILYDLGQLGYSAATGKNFWGQTVNKDDLVVTGLLVVLPLSAGGASTLRSLRAAVGRSTLRRALEADVLAQVQRAADTGFVEAVGKLSAKDADALAALLRRRLANPRSVPLTTLVGKLNEAIGRGYIAALEQRLLAKVFKEDFSGFRHAGLNAAYTRYLSKPRYRKRPDLAADPATWAKRQAATRGAPLRLLQQALGEDFVGVINRAQRAKRLPRKVTATDIANYDKLVSRGVEDYGSLRNAAKDLPGFGDLFEIDHLLEQRFWRNNPNLASAFDEKGLGMAFVVPKNAAVARSMFLGFGGQRIRYVHTVKTRMLRELMPHGLEPYFSVQQIWDAHVHVLRSLGAEPAITTRLAKDFQLMASELGETFTPRVPKPEVFRYENGWPRAIRNPDGSWTVYRVPQRR